MNFFLSLPAPHRIPFDLVKALAQLQKGIALKKRIAKQLLLTGQKKMDPLKPIYGILYLTSLKQV